MGQDAGRVWFSARSDVRHVGCVAVELGDGADRERRYSRRNGSGRCGASRRLSARVVEPTWTISMSTRSSSDLCVRVKRSARLLVIVVAPFLVVGLALTVAIIPAVIGLPLAIVSGLVVCAAWRARKMPQERRRQRWLLVAAVFTSVVLSVALAGSLVWVATILMRHSISSACLSVSAGWGSRGARWRFLAEVGSRP